MILDAFDDRILAEIQVDVATAAALAPRVNLSASAVTKRLARLRRSGLVTRTVAVLDPARVGPSVTALVLVSLDPDGPLTRDAFVAHAQGRPELTNVLLLAGDVGVALILRTRTLDQHAAALRDLQERFPQIRSLRTHIVVDQPKRSLAIPFHLTGIEIADAT